MKENLIIPEYPRVGVGALIMNDAKKFLLVLRNKSPEAGSWSIPGGRVEFMETIEDAITREVMEELGIKIKLISLLGITNHIIPEKRIHWVSPCFLAQIVGGEVANCAIEETQEYRWFSIKDMPKNIAMPAKNALSLYLRDT